MADQTNVGGNRHRTAADEDPTRSLPTRRQFVGISALGLGGLFSGCVEPLFRGPNVPISTDPEQVTVRTGDGISSSVTDVEVKGGATLGMGVILTVRVRVEEISKCRVRLSILAEGGVVTDEYAETHTFYPGEVHVIEPHADVSEKSRDIKLHIHHEEEL